MRLLLILPILLSVCACDAKREHTLTGRTMGTTYSIKVVSGYFGSVEVVSGYFGSVAGLQATVERRLDEVNRSMSPYIEDSEISRFNRFRETGVEFPVSADFLRVMQTAARVHSLSEGAWDGTVNPLVDLWGFGRAGRSAQRPPAETIAALLVDVGFDKIEIRGSGALVKRQAGVSLDLSSIAKGYGVDQVAEEIRRAGFSDFLVEIGGEIFAAGVRTDGRPWRIGINRPKADARFDEVYTTVALSGRAFATSGDYRNFFVQDGVRYAHILDPRTGNPVTNGVVSVSILADNCTLADGLATAVMVMGAEKGLALVNRLDGVQGLIITEAADGTLTDHLSRDFRLDSSAP